MIAPRSLPLVLARFAPRAFRGVGFARFKRNGSLGLECPLPDRLNLTPCWSLCCAGAPPPSFAPPRSWRLVFNGTAPPQSFSEVLLLQFLLSTNPLCPEISPED